jgi:hypothetical protein
MRRQAGRPHHKSGHHKIVVWTLAHTFALTCALTFALTFALKKPHFSRESVTFALFRQFSTFSPDGTGTSNRDVCIPWPTQLASVADTSCQFESYYYPSFCCHAARIPKLRAKIIGHEFHG